MSLRKVVLWPDTRLTTMCEPVAEVDDHVRVLAQDMLDTMYAAPGRGLAAPQVGVLLRLFVMDVAWTEGAPDPVVAVNPVVLSRATGIATMDEGCLSLPGVVTPVSRPDWVVLRWTALDGTQMAARLDGIAAVCAQHELDHLDGILTLDRTTPEARDAALAGLSDSGLYGSGLYGSGLSGSGLSGSGLSG